MAGATGERASPERNGHPSTPRWQRVRRAYYPTHRPSATFPSALRPCAHIQQRHVPSIHLSRPGVAPGRGGEGGALLVCLSIHPSTQGRKAPSNHLKSNINNPPPLPYCRSLLNYTHLSKPKAPFAPKPLEGKARIMAGAAQSVMRRLSHTSSRGVNSRGGR